MNALAFRSAGGTVCGADHLGNLGVPSDSNNQDSFLVRDLGDSLVAVVCDGCSDRRESGIGAALLCRFFVSAAEEILPQIKKVGQNKSIAAAMQQLVVEKMTAACALLSGGDRTNHKAIAKVADDLFLCTLVGCILTPEVSMVLASGDGVWGVNSFELTPLGPFPNNEPPYLGYLLRGNAPAVPELSLVDEIATKNLVRLAIGSDGCENIPAAVLSKILSADLTFSNPETINRELRKLNSQTVTLDGALEKLSYRISPKWSERKLDDDTTLIVIEPVKQPVIEQREHRTAESKSRPTSHPKRRLLGGLFGGSSADAPQ